MKIKNLKIIGTSHIALQSLDEVERTIKRLEPRIIAVELDRARAQALLKGSKSSIKLSHIRKIGVKGFLFALIAAYAERKLGELVGMKPGDEMLKAMQLAKKHKSMVMLIDQDVSITLRRFSKMLTWKEKGRMVVDVFKAVILKKPVVTFDLSTVPDKKMIKKLTKQLKKRYPNIHKVLVEERNHILAARLAAIMVNHPDDQIVAVMGAGHVDEVGDLIKKALKSLKQQKVHG